MPRLSHLGYRDLAPQTVIKAEGVEFEKVGIYQVTVTLCCILGNAGPSVFGA